MARDMIKELVSYTGSSFKGTSIVKVIDMLLRGYHIVAYRFVNIYGTTVSK